jgi:hypothetical protein
LISSFKRSGWSCWTCERHAGHQAVARRAFGEEAPLADRQPFKQFVLTQSVPPSRESTTPRAAAISTAQTDVLSMLQRSGAHTVHSFSTINAFATKVTASEATALANHPDVQAVVPDATIRAPSAERSREQVVRRGERSADR